MSLSGGATDRSSWDHIAWAASQMGVVCSTGQFPLGDSGGAMFVGSDGHIKVTIGSLGPVGEVDGGSGLATS